MAKAEKYCSQEIDDNISLYLNYSFSAVTKANVERIGFVISHLTDEVWVFKGELDSLLTVYN